MVKGVESTHEDTPTHVQHEQYIYTVDVQFIYTVYVQYIYTVYIYTVCIYCVVYISSIYIHIHMLTCAYCEKKGRLVLVK